MIKSMGMVCILGLIRENTVAGGTRESNMDWALILFQGKILSMDYGKMERELNGLIQELLRVFQQVK